MKYLMLTILFLCASVKGAYISQSSIGKCETGLRSFTSKSRCESVMSEKCFQAPKQHRCEYHELKDIMKDNLDAPEWGTRSMVEVCAGEQDCKDKALAKVCTDGRHSLYNAEYSEVWCNKIIGYAQIPSGLKSIQVNQVKKDAYDLGDSKKKARKERSKRGQLNRAKCKEALDYVAGSNTDSAMTEEQIDAMETSFAPILDALQKNRPQKASRLIGLVSDPAYADLKRALLEILAQ